MNQRDVKKEHEYLEKVLLLMKEQYLELSDKLVDKEEDIIQTRQEMFKNTTNNIRDFDDVIELSMQNDIVNEKTDDYTRITEQYKRLEELKVTPYYGRVDFKDNAKNEYNTFYIGKYSFYDKESFKYYIFDWRAPVSSLFYDYDIGEASFETPNGTRNGNINLKRQYEILNGEIGYMYDAESIAKDEIFAKVLSENTSKNLKVIISSIQKEQNKAIRHVNSKSLMIFGPAGSGKTSVGLHRMAYILYHNRDTLLSKNVAVISNNNIFSSYISNIIPELGEEGIKQFVFNKMVKPFIPKGYVISDYYEQVNFLMRARKDDTRIQGIKIKSSYSFLEYMEAYFKSLKLEFSDLTYNKKIICSKEEMENLFYDEDGQKSFKELISRVNYFIENQYKEYFLLKKKTIKKSIADKSSEFLEPAQIESIYQRLLHENIKRAKDSITQTNNLDEIFLYKLILKEYLQDNKLDISVLDQTIYNIEKRILNHEDYIVILSIKILLNKINIDQTIKHVLIDEAQDYSLMQLFFIKNLFPHSHFTILADTNQALHPFISTNNENKFLDIFKDDASKLYLHQSYRSTGPINKLSFSLLKSDEDISYFSRKGQMPSCIKSIDLAETISSLMNPHIAENKLIGIITKTTKQAKDLYQVLKDKVDVQLIADPKDKMGKSIMILPVILAKGLEFDSVIAYIDGDNQNSWDDKNILYLMSTRALHDLYFVHTGDFPNVFKGYEHNIKIVDEC